MAKWVGRGVHMLSIPFEMTELVEYSLYGHFVAGGSCVEAPGASLSRRRRQRHELRLGGGGAGARTSTGSTFNPKKKKNSTGDLLLLVKEVDFLKPLRPGHTWSALNVLRLPVIIILITSLSRETITDTVFQGMFVITVYYTWLIFLTYTQLINLWHVNQSTWTVLIYNSPLLHNI